MHLYIPRLSRLLLAGLCVCLLLSVQAFGASEQNNLGIEAYEAGRYAEAIRHFEQALLSAPDSLVVRRNLCNTHQAAANEYAQKQDYAAAARHLEKAIKADPKNPSPLVQLGSYYLRLKMIPQAIERLEAAVQAQPGHIDAHEMLGQAYYEDNDLSSARVQWDYVLEAEPDRDYLRQQYEKAFREESVQYSFHSAESSHFRISYPRGVTRAQQTQILSILERAYRDINGRFSVYPPGQVQVIVYSAEQFAEATQLEAHVGAVFDGKIRIPLTDGDGDPLSHDELSRRLQHEYVHVLLRHIASDKVPWWLNEGLAEKFSDVLSDRELDILRKAYTDGLAFSFANLESNQLSALSPDVLRLAYLQSHAAASYLWIRYGQQRMAKLLSDLAVGAAPEEALRSIYGYDYPRLDAAIAAAYG